MALVKCPECGRDNISDTAESCPNCGYAIKQHFGRIKLQEYQAAKEAEFEKAVQVEYQKLLPAMERELREIDNLPYPEKPTLRKTFLGIEGGEAGLTYTILGALPVLFLLGPMTDSYFFTLLLAIDLLIIPFVLIDRYSSYKWYVDIYEEKISDWEKYKEKRKNQVRINYKKEAENMAKYGKPSAPSMPYVPANAPKCPTCGSTKVKRISTTSRVVSVATVGIASSKIGKQFECENCHYKW